MCIKPHEYQKIGVSTVAKSLVFCGKWMFLLQTWNGVKYLMDFVKKRQTLLRICNIIAFVLNDEQTRHPSSGTAIASPICYYPIMQSANTTSNWFRWNQFNKQTTSLPLNSLRVYLKFCFRNQKHRFLLIINLKTN